MCLGASILIDGNRIAAVEARSSLDPADATVLDARGAYVVPGFVDVHVHGVESHDTLDDGDPIARISAALPRYGVTAFCPTTVACPPDRLRGVLTQVAAARA